MKVPAGYLDWEDYILIMLSRVFLCLLCLMTGAIVLAIPVAVVAVLRNAVNP